MSKKIICFSLLLSLVLFNVISYAKLGKVNASNLNIRSLPSTKNSSKIGILQRGQEINILENELPADSEWYKIEYKKGKKLVDAYVKKEFILVEEEDIREEVSSNIHSPISDRDFENHLASEGFSESYKIELRKLHEKYPNWIFRGQKTGLDFEEVIENQAVVGRNLVHKNAPNSWKSTKDGAYDFKTGKWVGFDTSKWVAASEDVIRHFIDPRNFLDEKYIFQFLDNNYGKREYSKEALSDILKGTFLEKAISESEDVDSEEVSPANPKGRKKAKSPLDEIDSNMSYADIIMEAGKSSDVNPYVLASMLIQEQGVNGTSPLISGNVESYRGIYNFFNVGAYQAGDLSPITRGLWWASIDGSYDRPWTSRKKAIIGGAKYYGENYVKAAQNTLYLKKYNVLGVNRYKHQYMTNVEGAADEGAKLSKAYKNIMDREILEFEIPIYNNMPDEKAKKPLESDKISFENSPFSPLNPRRPRDKNQKTPLDASQSIRVPNVENGVEFLGTGVPKVKNKIGVSFDAPGRR